MVGPISQAQNKHALSFTHVDTRFCNLQFYSSLEHICDLSVVIHIFQQVVSRNCSFVLLQPRCIPLDKTMPLWLCYFFTTLCWILNERLISNKQWFLLPVQGVDEKSRKVESFNCNIFILFGCPRMHITCSKGRFFQFRSCSKLLSILQYKA